MNLGGNVLLLLPICVCVLQLEWVAAGVESTRARLNLGTNVGPESAEGLIQLLRRRGIGKIRLHDADPEILLAIGSSKERPIVDVIVGVTNDEIVDVGVSPASAQRWIARNVVQYLPATNIIAIAVGSELLTSRQNDHFTIVPFIVPAMRNLYAALTEAGLEKQIKVSAPQSARVLSGYFPPSSASFKGGSTAERGMASLLKFLESSGSYFMLNLYPQDLQNDDGVVGLKQRPQSVEDFPAASGGVDDPQTGRHYSSVEGVLTDAVSVAIASFLGRHQLGVIGIAMEWSGISGSSWVQADRLTVGGLAVDIDPRFGEHSVKNSPKMEKKVLKTKSLFSRRFLMDPAQTKQPNGSVKKRRLANKSWCVAKPDASTSSLQNALDWTCGNGGKVDCQPIEVGQSCYLPNTIVAHASYAFNSYYQQNSWATASCDFGGIAELTTSDPSTTTCLYSSSTSANGTPSTPTGTTIPNVAAPSRVPWDRCRFILTSLILIFLAQRTFPNFRD